jgi:hypothetical protein
MFFSKQKEKSQGNYGLLKGGDENDEKEGFLPSKEMVNERAWMPSPSRRQVRGMTWTWAITAVNVVVLILSATLAVFAYKYEHRLLQNRRNSLLKAIDAYCK